MPTDDLDEAKASARKLELGQMRKGKFLNECDSDESSDDSEDENLKKKKGQRIGKLIPLRMTSNSSGTK